MNKTVSSSFNGPDSALSVTLYNSGFSKDGNLSGRVSRRIITLENILSMISQENTGLAPYAVQHSAILIQQQILKMLRLGYGVNVLDLGIIYIGLKGGVKDGTATPGSLKDFTLRYTPSALANETITDLQVEKVVISDTSPHITTVSNPWTHENDSVSKGKHCQIVGDRLKLGGDEYSLSFVPLEDDGSVSKTLPAIQVEEERILKNTNKYLEFFVPDELDSEKKYVIRVTSSYINGTHSRKTPLSADSNPIAVEI